MKINIDINSNTILRILLRIAIILLAILLGYYFSSLLLYIFLAFIFSLIGKPVAKKLSSIKIYKFKIPHGISSLLTLILFVLCFMLILLFFIPMLAREAQVIANINYDDLSVNLGHLLNNVQNFLYSNGLIGEHETLVGIITTELKEFANLATFSNMLGGFLSATGSFFFGLFAVLFLTFFFIKDDFRLEGVAILLFGKRHAIRLTIVSNKINNLLSRYFIGLLTEIAAMIVLLYIGLALFGIKGALLFAVFGGMLNAIPYLGPIIGAVTCCVFGIVNCISINEYFDILPTILKIAGTFIGANLIDNAILQPYIYSHSVKAHPAEIFLVIIMGGSLAGILGMLFAIPVYTIIRTIVVELFNYMNGK